MRHRRALLPPVHGRPRALQEIRNIAIEICMIINVMIYEIMYH